MYYDISIIRDEDSFTARCKAIPAEGDGYWSPYIPAHLEVVRVLDAAGRAIAYDSDPELWEIADRAAERA